MQPRGTPLTNLQSTQLAIVNDRHPQTQAEGPAALSDWVEPCELTDPQRNDRHYITADDYVVLEWMAQQVRQDGSPRVLIVHSPLMSWVYDVSSVTTVACALARMEILAAPLIALDGV
jgi:hypothetical protein